MTGIFTLYQCGERELPAATSCTSSHTSPNFANFCCFLRAVLLRLEVIFYSIHTNILNTVLTALTKEYSSILVHIIRELPGSLLSCKFMHRTTSFCFLYTRRSDISAMLTHITTRPAHCMWWLYIYMCVHRATISPHPLLLHYIMARTHMPLYSLYSE